MGVPMMRLRGVIFKNVERGGFFFSSTLLVPAQMVAETQRNFSSEEE